MAFMQKLFNNSAKKIPQPQSTNNNNDNFEEVNETAK